MKNSKLICLIVAFTMIAVQVSAKGGYKRKVELKKEWRVQTKSPQEVPLQAFLIENQQLEIQSQGLFDLNIQVENSQGNIMLVDIVCLDSSQSTIIELEHFSQGKYIL